MSRFETEILATDENLKKLTDLCGRWVDQVADRIPIKQLTLDMDSSENPYQQPNEESFQFVYCDILSKRIRGDLSPREGPANSKAFDQPFRR